MSLSTFCPRFSLLRWFLRYAWKCRYNIGHSGITQPPDIEFPEIRDVEIGYPGGKDELIAEISDMYNVEKNEIVLTMGVGEANFLFFLSVLNRGDEVLVEAPTYQPLYSIPQILGAKVNFVQRKGFKLNPEDVEKKMNKRIRCIIITNLNNPTGVAIDASALKKTSEIAEENNAYLICDEIYREFLSPIPRPVALYGQHCISTSGLTKIYGLGGIRIGWLVGNKKICEKVRRIKELTTNCNPTWSETIAIYVLRRRDEFISRARKISKENFKIIREWSKNEKNIKLIEPDGGVICFPKITGDVSSMALAIHLAEKYSTFISPGEYFRMKKHFRIGFGGNKRILKEALKKVSEGLEDLII